MTANAAAIRCLTFLALAISLCAFSAGAQTAPLPLGQVGSLSQLNHCPSGFYTGTPQNQTVCYQTTVYCPSADPIGLTFSYLNPAAPNAPLGTIVLFTGGGGEITSNDGSGTEAKDYFLDNYAVVQTSWGWDWEDTNGGTVMIQPPPAYSILTAACRPATFLNFINTNSSPQFFAPGTGMCAQGFSAGSGAVAYAIVWYGMGSTLNNAELSAGPVFGDVEIGCQVPNVGDVNICSNSQRGCSPQTLVEVQSPPVGMGPWLVAPQYIDSYLASVQTWTGNLAPACNNTQGQSTGGTNPLTGNNAIWKAESIVTGAGGAFTWPSTLKGLGGWACYSYMQNTCGQYCPNNSGPEGEQFYSVVSQQSVVPAGYSLTGIQLCYGAEGTAMGVDPDNPALSGEQAIESHMKTYCSALH